ncbi:hypothetical protein M8J77_017784 [Diaphorina citri]|nr:hypothetical protein M8J77_017784 [Diaphorina citri]
MCRNACAQTNEAGVININYDVIANGSVSRDVPELHRTCTIIDVAVPADMNVEKKEAEKKLKYKDLAIEIEIERMWNIEVKIVPIVIGALGVVSSPKIA